MFKLSTSLHTNTRTHTHTNTKFLVINQVRVDGGAKQIREKNPGQYTSSLPLTHTSSHTHTFTHIPTLSQARLRWFWGDFIAAVLLMVPVKHETLLFPPNHTHMHCLWAVIQDIHRQPGTRSWRQLYQARKSCQVLYWSTHIHVYTLILDLYGVLHPPLSTAVKVFLNSSKSTIFKELHTNTHWRATLTSKRT